MIQKIFHTYYWTFPLLFLISLSYFFAKIAGHLTLLLLPIPTPTIQASPSLSSNDQIYKPSTFALSNSANLFDPKQTPITDPKTQNKKKKGDPEDKEQKESKTCDPSGSYIPSKLPLELKGTVIASDPEYSLAVIHDKRRRKNVILRVGDIFSGLQICSIEYDKQGRLAKKKQRKTYVKLDRGQGRFEYLELGAKGGSGKTNYRKNIYKHYRKLRNKKFNLKNIKRKKNGRLEIPGDLLEKVTKRLDIVASQAAIVPYFDKGRSAGFRIYNIKSNSLYQKLGLKNGDVIKRINGYEFTSPQKALEAYSNLMSAGNLAVEIKRKGKNVNLGYDVKR